MGLIPDMYRAEEKYIQFSGDDGDEFHPTAGATGFQISIEVTNGVGTKNPFSEVSEVTVNIDEGTDAPGAMINGAGDSVVVAIAEGVGELNVAVSGPGTVKLSMTDSGATGLDVSEKVDVIFTAA